MRLARNNRLVDWQLQEGVLDDLAQGRVYPVLTPRKVSNSLAMGNGLDERGDKERSLVAENVGTEKPAGFGVGVELAQTCVILQSPAVGNIAVFL